MRTISLFAFVTVFLSSIGKIHSQCRFTDAQLAFYTITPADNLNAAIRDQNDVIDLKTVTITCVNSALSLSAIFYGENAIRPYVRVTCNGNRLVDEESRVFRRDAPVAACVPADPTTQCTETAVFASVDPNNVFDELLRAYYIGDKLEVNCPGQSWRKLELHCRGNDVWEIRYNGHVISETITRYCGRITNFCLPKNLQVLPLLPVVDDMLLDLHYLEEKTLQAKCITGNTTKSLTTTCTKGKWEGRLNSTSTVNEVTDLFAKEFCSSALRSLPTFALAVFVTAFTGLFA